jgi:AcrR family transcriptional regulator
MAPPRKHHTDSILDAARTLVLASGPRAASVAAIAKASRAPVGTLYHRFGSRDAILAAVWLRGLERFQAIALDAAAHEDGALERAVALARSSVTFAERHPDDARLLLALRRDDLLDTSPDGQLSETLEAMNAPLIEELVALTRRLYGRAGPRALARVTRAVVDLPLGALRRHLAPGGPPPWLAADIAADARSLLQAPSTPRPVRSQAPSTPRPIRSQAPAPPGRP